MTYFFVALGAVAVIVWLLISLAASVSLYRTEQLTRGQKLAQSAIVWCVPFVGGSLVMHFLAEADPDVFGQRLIPNDTVNEYVLQTLRIQARASIEATKGAMRESIIDAICGQGEDGGGSGGSAGGGDGD